MRYFVGNRNPCFNYHCDHFKTKKLAGVRTSGGSGSCWLGIPFIGGEMKIFHSSLSVDFLFIYNRKMSLFLPLADHSMTVNRRESS